MNNRTLCPLCGCYHLGDGLQPCPNYDPLRDVLFDNAEVELSEQEASALRWLAGTADWQTRDALVSLFRKARSGAR